MDLRKICQEYGVSGKGITVAVLDTGIGKHPDLKDKVLAYKDFVNNRKQMYDDNGHGSHIGGIICGNGSASKGVYKGIAPGANLVVGKVLDRAGGGMVENTLEGLAWILDIRRKYGIRIVNLSIGIADLKDGKKKASLEQMLDKCWREGLLVVTAAGNNCKEYSAKSLCGKHGSALVVGTMEGGPCNPDIIAWGKDILSCDTKKGYTRKSGSSMATPIVSGCAALLWEKSPRLSNRQIKEKMKATATDVKLPWHIQGWGMINLRKLLT
ncbi:MAG: S8 family serine peptidase [Lachnospiraceae bacterium]|nr:S8 family serine peptidase [Lachnospiraceae bacterium]